MWGREVAEDLDWRGAYREWLAEPSPWLAFFHKHGISIAVQEAHHDLDSDPLEREWDCSKNGCQEMCAHERWHDKGVPLCTKGHWGCRREAFDTDMAVHGAFVP